MLLGLERLCKHSPVPKPDRALCTSLHTVLAIPMRVLLPGTEFSFASPAYEQHAHTWATAAGGCFTKRRDTVSTCTDDDCGAPVVLAAATWNGTAAQAVRLR